LTCDLILREIMWRRSVFENLDKYLDLLVRVVKEVDGNASIYLFGSVAEGKHIAASDIDVLVVTRAKPG